MAQDGSARSSPPVKYKFVGGKLEPVTEPVIGDTAKIAGATGILGAIAALALRRPDKAKAFAHGLNSLRQQLMLSGFALPKSLLGNLGAAVERGIETKSLDAVKQLLSRETLSDAVSAYKRGGVVSGTPGVDEAMQGGNMLTRAASYLAPGRVMGAMDEATQGALRRSGASAAEAQSATLQKPLQADLAAALDSPVARYIHPFRRTPFNQFLEGLKRMPGGSEGSARAKTIYMGTGAVHGAATAEDDMPLSIPLATAAASRYGLPYAAAALLGRTLAGGKGGGGIPSGALPVSEWGWESSITSPLRPFKKPAALTALEKVTGG